MSSPGSRFQTSDSVITGVSAPDTLTRRGRELRELHLVREDVRRQAGPLAADPTPDDPPVVDLYGRSTEQVRTDAVASVVIPDAAGEWSATWLVAEQDGRYVARSVLLEPLDQTTPVGGLTTNLLRELRPAEAARAAASAISDSRAQPAPDAIHSYEEFAHLWRVAAEDDRALRGPAPPAPRRIGRPPLSDEHLADVARVYLAELPLGGGVLKRMAKQFGREPATMRDQVHLARKRGWLTKAPKPGMKGASPGPRLIELMETLEAEQSDD